MFFKYSFNTALDDRSGSILTFYFKTLLIFINIKILFGLENNIVLQL